MTVDWIILTYGWTLEWLNTILVITRAFIHLSLPCTMYLYLNPKVTHMSLKYITLRSQSQLLGAFRQNSEKSLEHCVNILHGGKLIVWWIFPWNHWALLSHCKKSWLSYQQTNHIKCDKFVAFRSLITMGIFFSCKNADPALAHRAKISTP